MLGYDMPVRFFSIRKQAEAMWSLCEKHEKYCFSFK